MSNILPGRAAARSWKLLEAQRSSAPSPASCPAQPGTEAKSREKLGDGARAIEARGTGTSPRCQGEGREDAAWHGGKQPGGSGWGRQLRAPSRAGLEARSWLCAARSSLFWKGGVLTEGLVRGAADAGEQDGSHQVPAMPCRQTLLGFNPQLNLPQHNQDWIPSS